MSPHPASLAFIKSETQCENKNNEALIEHLSRLPGLNTVQRFPV